MKGYCYKCGRLLGDIENCDCKPKTIDSQELKALESLLPTSILSTREMLVNALADYLKNQLASERGGRTELPDEVLKVTADKLVNMVCVSSSEITLKNFLEMYGKITIG